MKTNTKVSTIISLVLRAVALGMAVTALVMNFLGVADPDAIINLLGIGLFTLALDALDRGPEVE